VLAECIPSLDISHMEGVNEIFKGLVFQSVHGKNIRIQAVSFRSFFAPESSPRHVIPVTLLGLAGQIRQVAGHLFLHLSWHS